MKLTAEIIPASSLTPGDLYSPDAMEVDDWQSMLDGAGIVKLWMRTEGPLKGIAPETQVQRLHIDRKRWTHGLRGTYAAGCRCTSCTNAQRIYMRTYFRERSAEKATA